MNYEQLASKYKPNNIKTLLIGEAPPPTQESYFYKPVKPGSGFHFSLPGIVFRHYFGKTPKSENEYKVFLDNLQKEGVFLIDISNEPLKVSKKEPGNKWPKAVPESILKIKNSLPALKSRIKDLGVSEKDIVFLLPRKQYLSDVKRIFPDVPASNIYTTWKSFAENRS